MNKLSIAGQTDVGRRRTDNQDTFISAPIWSDASALLVVIDGVGGYAGGDRAAAIARDSIERYMATPSGKPLTMLREAVVFANNQIHEERQQNAELAKMCCVLTAAMADTDAGKLYFVHVGDTRLYRYRRDVLEKLTADHSLVGIREDANQLTEAEAMQHPRRNEILREVGSALHRVDDPDFLDSGETDFLPGDLLLLCSDGLTDMITQARITGVLNRPLALDEQVADLIKLANKQGGNDNITVVLAKNNTQPAENQPVVPAEPTPLPTNQGALPQRDLAETGRPIALAPRKRLGLWGVGTVLMVGILAYGWYRSVQPDTAVKRTDPVGIGAGPAARRVSGAGQTRLDSLVRLAWRTTHRLTLPADTLRIEQPLLLTDSLLVILGTNRPTVIVPADTAQATVAVRVSSRETVTLENVVISGFKTGIETTGPTRLQLKNVYFRDVSLPVRAAIRQDTCRNTILTISAQDQPLLPKRPPN